MGEKSKGKIITVSLSAAAAAILTIASLISVISYLSNIARFGLDAINFWFCFYFSLQSMFMSGGIALLVLSIYGFKNFTDKAIRKVGKASVIAFLGVECFFLLILIIQMIINSSFILDVALLIYLILSIGLLVAFFVCDKKFSACAQTTVTAQTSAQSAAQSVEPSAVQPAPEDNQADK